MNEQTEEQLLRYLDGDLNERETQILKHALEQSPALQSKLTELENLHRLLARKAKLELPSKNFTQRVMEGLDHFPQTSLLSPRHGLYLLLGIVVASGLLIALLTGGVFNGMTTVLSVDNPLTNQNLIDVTNVSLPFDGKNIIKGIIFVNLALAFVMLDRTILRPLFRQRNMGAHG